MNGKRVIKIAFSSLTLGVMFLSTGCASIIGNPDQQLVFNSTPNKADVYVDGTKRATTPCNILVPRRRPPPPIVLKLEGYEDAPVVFTSKYNFLMYFNFLWGYCSTTGFLVDMGSNNSVMYWPDTFLVTLEPKQGTTPGEKAAASEQKQKSNIVRFVTTNYDALVLEISKGKGEHLTALFDLLTIKEEERAGAVVKIKPLYIKYNDPVELGRAIEMEFPRE